VQCESKHPFVGKNIEKNLGSCGTAALKELNQAASDGYELMGFLKCGEVMAIMRKRPQ
jgi:hypothetical protein